MFTYWDCISIYICAYISSVFWPQDWYCCFWLISYNLAHVHAYTYVDMSIFTVLLLDNQFPGLSISMGDMSSHILTVHQYYIISFTGRYNYIKLRVREHSKTPTVLNSIYMHDGCIQIMQIFLNFRFLYIVELRINHIPSYSVCVCHLQSKYMYIYTHSASNRTDYFQGIHRKAFSQKVHSTHIRCNFRK
jgi:hypothetical protein